jgi:hypothetical protein
MSFVKLFELVIEILIDFFEKFFSAFLACKILPFPEQKIIIGFDSAILFSHLFETFLVLFEQLIVFKKFSVNINFVLNVFFLFFEGVFLNEISFGLYCKIFII